MKKITLTLLIVFSFFTSIKAIAQQGFGTNRPDKSAAVDIVSSKRGLLIPRLALTSTTVATPVNSPAESLLVYNTATTGDVTPGYYYWDADPTTPKWVRFVSAANEKTVTVSAGDNITVTSNVTGNTTDYEVAVAGGTDGQVLVTQIVGGNTTTAWVDPSTFIQNVTASNGLSIDALTNDVELGGALNEATTIDTNGNNLAIAGLDDVSTTFDSTTQNIVVMGTDGVLKLVSPQTLVRANETVTIFRNNSDGTFTYFSESEIDAAGNVTTGATGVTIDTNASALGFSNTGSGLTATNVQAAIDEIVTNTVTADNGLTKTGNNIQLGEPLTKATVITTGGNTETLAIVGLVEPAATASASIVLADETSGVLTKVARSLEYATGVDFAVASQTDYNKLVQEITIFATIGTADINITLPLATLAKGQVINVKIANTTEPNNYVYIPNVDGTTIYGAMPYQGWIIKSNGTSWSVVGRH